MKNITTAANLQDLLVAMYNERIHVVGFNPEFAGTELGSVAIQVDMMDRKNIVSGESIESVIAQIDAL